MAFTRAGLALLAALERDNDRAWFAARRERFEAELFEPMRALVRESAAALAAEDVAVSADAKRSVFRFARDVRFGPDERPYRTTLAAYLSWDAGRHTPGGVYVEVGPAGGVVVAAFYRLEPPVLARFRASIAAEPDAMRAVAAALGARGLAITPPDAYEDAYRRVPAAYAAAPADLRELFRLRSFTVRRPLDASDVVAADLAARVAEFGRDALPLLAWGWCLV